MPGNFTIYQPSTFPYTLSLSADVTVPTVVKLVPGPDFTLQFEIVIFPKVISAFSELAEILPVKSICPTLLGTAGFFVDGGTTLLI